jgi:16S rRNA (cytidine1402-2'-O)-methyltransferase
LALGTLYLVGTPIGNLEDITARAIKTLKEVDLIAAEDTRHTGKLLHHFQIQTDTISYHIHNVKERIPFLVAKIEEGAAIALVTDAGMPGISDPGTELVQVCIANHIQVIPIPGVTAGITALVASGMDTQSFVFEGFLSIDNQVRRSQLNIIKAETRTLILYESPHRILRTLIDLQNTLGSDRQIAIARELTKLHETFWRGSLVEAINHYQTHSPRGEFTLILAGRTPEEKLTYSDIELVEKLKKLIAEGMSHSQASRELAEILEIPRRQIYQLALDSELDSKQIQKE